MFFKNTKTVFKIKSSTCICADHNREVHLFLFAGGMLSIDEPIGRPYSICAEQCIVVHRIIGDNLCNVNMIHWYSWYIHYLCN